MDRTNQWNDLIAHHLKHCFNNSELSENMWYNLHIRMAFPNIIRLQMHDDMTVYFVSSACTEAQTIYYVWKTFILNVTLSQFDDFVLEKWCFLTFYTIFTFSSKVKFAALDGNSYCCIMSKEVYHSLERRIPQIYVTLDHKTNHKCQNWDLYIIWKLKLWWDNIWLRYNYL